VVDLETLTVAGPVSAPENPALDLAAVFEAEFDYVWLSLRRLGIPSKDLQDLTHDVFVAVHRHRAEYDPSRPLRPWLFGFAARVAWGHRRRARFRREHLPDRTPDAVDPAPLADAVVEQRRAQDLLQRGIEALDDGRRAVLILHDLDGFAMPVIAATLGLPLNTAYSRLRLAREQLAAAVRRIENEQGGRE
jgi:RNA polymerase sigma-70 factor (ECF subfamily)